MQIRPLADHILIEPLKQEEKTKSGILLPETAEKERPEQGKVVAVGPGKMTDEGKLVPMEVKPGDVVLFTKYGPKGRNVMLEEGYGSPTITNDGVTIAKKIELEDKLEQAGAEIVKEVASKANDMAGDGTTTATVLAQALISEGLKNVTAGANPLALRRGMEKAKDEVVKYIKTAAKQISSQEEMVQVATISAEDAELGALIAQVMEEIGKDGVITVTVITP